MKPYQSSRSIPVRAVGGFSLIEMMISIFFGLLVVLGVIALFDGTNRVSRVQDALARLQENGRFGITAISNDLRMTGGQYCSNSGGVMVPPANLPAPNGGLDGGRSPIMHALVGPLPDFGTTGTLADAMPTGWPANTPYPVSPRFFIQGYTCVGTCVPALPANMIIPASGTGAGSRADGSDILTVRYMQAPGWSVFETGSSQICGAAGTGIKGKIVGLNVVPKATDPPLNFAAGDLAMLSDCSISEIFAFTPPTFVPAGNFNNTKVPCVNASVDARIFNFTKDFVTVTYYLELRPDPDTAGRVISALMRKVNGAPGVEIVQGVDRLNFLYGVEDGPLVVGGVPTGGGAMRYMTAAQINASPLGNPPCPPPPPGWGGNGAVSAALPEAGCLWRAVRSIEVFMLLNSVNNQPISAIDQQYRYSFSDAGVLTATGAAIAPPPATMVSGVPSGTMMRREFRALVSLRNHNH